MPGPIIQQQPLPEWLTGPSDARGRAAVGQAFLRGLVSMLGLDDPKQIVGVGMPIDVGASSGGLIDAVATRFPRFAQAIKSYMSPTVGGQLSPPFYSRLDEAVQTLPKQTFGPRIAGIAQKGQASAEELAARKVPQFIEAAGNKPIQRAALEAHLAEHPVPQLDVKTLSEMRFPTNDQALEAWTKGKNVQWVGPNGNVVQVEHPATISDPRSQYAQDVKRGLAYWRVGGTNHLGQIIGAPKYSTYQLPGGENYRETLITLPNQGEAGFQKLLKQRDAVDAQINAYHAARGDDRFAPHPPELVKQYNALQDQINAMQGQQFKSSHFDEPNVLVHTRSNERDLPGLGRGTFLEEVQSDWHQKGKAHGYQGISDDAERKAVEELAGSRAALVEAIRKIDPDAAPDSEAAINMLRRHMSGRSMMLSLTPEMEAGLRQPFDAFTRAEYQLEQVKNKSLVPDAPFKETWPDLALKHHIIEAAQDPKTQWLGFTSGETQAARYDLSKHINELLYEPKSKRLLAFTKDGDKAIEEIVQPEKLADYIGKEAAKKLLDQPVSTPYGIQAHTLTGVDLKVGGEGMREFYDKLLPKRLEKIVKPFGGTVERMTSQQTGNADLVGSWVVRLTPEMKAKILRMGIPLMTGFGAVQAAKQQGQR